MNNQNFDIYAYGCTYIPNKIFYSLTISDTNITQYAMCLHILFRTYGKDLDAAPIIIKEFAACIYHMNYRPRDNLLYSRTRNARPYLSLRDTFSSHAPKGMYPYAP